MNAAGSTRTPAIRATGVDVALAGTPIVTDAHLEVAVGEWITILGPNGAGKTTFLRALAGTTPATGRIELHGSDLTDLGNRDRARTIAVVNQLPTIPAGMSVTHYVLLGRTAHLGPLGRETDRDLERVADALTELDLDHLADRSLDTLSGGERQRALLARGVAQEASILLLDEPTTALDIAHQQRTLEIIDRLRRRRSLTVVSTMHDLTLAGRHADRLVLMAAGRIARTGSPHEVLNADDLGRHYGTTVEVIHHRGRPVVVPVGPTLDDPDPDPDPVSPPETRPTRRPTQPEKEGPTMTERDPEEIPTEDPRPDDLRRAPSLVLVNTGNGKGKTSAAMGVVIRGVGRGWPVAVIQFLKSGTWNTGEEKVCRQLGVDWWAEGEGFTWLSEDLTLDQAVAAAAWDQAEQMIAAGDHRLIVLDEITYPLNWGWIDTDRVVDAITNRPERTNVVLTGRNAPQPIIDLADTVTEMGEIKHAYQSGIRAMKGIDY